MKQGCSDLKLFFLSLTANIAEWYDFVVFAYLAKPLSILFFADSDEYSSILKILMIFAASYFARPIGAIIFGMIADRKGRKQSFVLSLWLMGLSSVCISILPDAKHIGLLAPILLVAVRLLQGISAGGELPTLSTYVYERASGKNRGFLTGVVNSGSLAGVLTGSFMVFVLYLLFSSHDMLEYGWRLAFLIGVLLLLPSLIILRGTEISNNYDTNNLSAMITFKNIKVLLLSSLCVGSLQVVFYSFFVWMPTYFHTILGHSGEVSHFSNTLSLAVMFLGIFLCSMFLLKVRAGKMFFVGNLAALICVTPAIYLIYHANNLIMLLIVQVIVAMIISLMDAPILLILNRAFPVRCRSTMVNIAFTMPSVLLGGITPLALTWILFSTSVTYWWMVSGYILLFLIFGAISSWLLLSKNQEV